jgi:hypothetical protein
MKKAINHIPVVFALVLIVGPAQGQSLFRFDVGDSVIAIKSFSFREQKFVPYGVVYIAGDTAIRAWPEDSARHKHEQTESVSIHDGILLKSLGPTGTRTAVYVIRKKLLSISPYSIGQAFNFRNEVFYLYDDGFYLGDKRIENLSIARSQFKFFRLYKDGTNFLIAFLHGEDSVMVFKRVPSSENFVFAYHGQKNDMAEIDGYVLIDNLRFLPAWLKNFFDWRAVEYRIEQNDQFLILTLFPDRDSVRKYFFEGTEMRRKYEGKNDDFYIIKNENSLFEVTIEPSGLLGEKSLKIYKDQKLFFSETSMSEYRVF